jgi:hypothetical protein
VSTAALMACPRWRLREAITVDDQLPPDAREQRRLYQSPLMQTHGWDSRIG